MRHDWFGLRKLLRNRRVAVLMYHRVADLETDPWELAVSPANFEAQIAYLNRKYKVLSVEELAHQLQKGKIASDSVCITFDDGYKDNVEAARPILEKYSCPATFFIATKYLTDQQPYWWDELEHIILHSPRLSSVLEININGELFSFPFEGEEILTKKQIQQHQRWTWAEEPPTRRCAAYFSIWEKLKPLPFLQIQETLTQLKRVVQEASPNATAHFPMTLDQLKDLAQNPLFTIGLHTDTHPALKFHSRVVQLTELHENRRQLETLLNRRIGTLSYPYGIYDDNTLSIADELNLKLAFTTNPRVVAHQSAPFKLGRIPVQNQDVPSFAKTVSQYFG